MGLMSVGRLAGTASCRLPDHRVTSGGRGCRIALFAVSWSMLSAGCVGLGQKIVVASVVTLMGRSLSAHVLAEHVLLR